MVLLVVLHLLVLLVIVELVWFLVPPTSPPRKCILVQTRVMVDFGDSVIIARYTPLHHLGLRVMKFVLLMPLCSLVLFVMVEVVCFLAPPTSTPTNIVGLMVVVSVRESISQANNICRSRSWRF